MTRQLEGDGNDDGISLIELVVYILLAVIVVGGMASIFANAWRSQSQTASRDAATGSSALVAASLSQSVRNASDFKVEADGKILRAIVATGASTWECRAWALTSSGDFLYKASPSAIAVGDTTGWTRLVSDASGTLTNGAAFMDAGTLPKQMQIGIKITKATQPVVANSALTAQAKIPGGGPCGW